MVNTGRKWLPCAPQYITKKCECDKGIEVFILFHFSEDKSCCMTNGYCFGQCRYRESCSRRKNRGGIIKLFSLNPVESVICLSV